MISFFLFLNQQWAMSIYFFLLSFFFFSGGGGRMVANPLGAELDQGKDKLIEIRCDKLLTEI